MDQHSQENGTRKKNAAVTVEETEVKGITTEMSEKADVAKIEKILGTMTPEIKTRMTPERTKITVVHIFEIFKKIFVDRREYWEEYLQEITKNSRCTVTEQSLMT